MGFFNKYPYTDFHELNLDWLLNEITRLKAEVERLSKLGEKIDEVLELLKHYEEMLAYVMGKGLVDVSYYDLYAQVLPETNPHLTNWASQGFCIGQIGSTVVSLNCFVDKNTNDINKLVFTDFLNGAQLGSYSVTAGHANSCCFCPENGHFYVACGGGGSARKSIQEYDYGGNLINETAYAGYDFWSITYHDKKFYAQGGGSRLVVLDIDMNIIDEFIMENEGSLFTYQGMCCDDNFIYILNGNTILRDSTEPLKWRNINRITAISYEGKNIKNIDVKFPLEVEEGDIYNGKLYLSANTSSRAFIVSSDLYCRNSINCWGRFNNNIGVNEYTQDITVDEDYEGFKVDGSATMPIPALALIDLYSKQAITYLRVNIVSDIKTLTFISLRRVEIPVISFLCNNHIMPNIRSRSKEMYITDAVFPGQDTYDTIEYHGERLALNNITFGTSGSAIVPRRLLFTTSSIEADGFIVNQSADYLMYVLGCGYLRAVTINVASAFNILTHGVTIPNGFPIEQLKYASQDTYANDCYLVTDYNRTIDARSIKVECIISHAGGTLTNIPAGVSLGSIMAIEYKFYRFTNNRMLATYYLNDDTVVHDHYQF